MIAGVENREEVREAGLWAKTRRVVSKDGWDCESLVLYFAVWTFG